MGSSQPPPLPVKPAPIWFTLLLIALVGFLCNKACQKDVAPYEAILAKEQAVAQLQEKARNCALRQYLAKVDALLSLGEDSLTLPYLDSAFAFAVEDRGMLSYAKGEILVRQKRYEAAVDAFGIALSHSYRAAEAHYQRAKCYEAIKDRQSAVAELRSAISMGHEAADSLHNKINPARKHLSGYVTRCCDGSTSHARGRGACSHHGGVCDWNEPVYVERRKY